MPYTEGFYLDKGVWKVMTLTDQEVKELEKEHRRECNRIMSECIEDSKSIIKPFYSREISMNYGLKDLMSVEINTSNSLFEARCPKWYSFTQNKLHEKIAKMRKGIYIDGTEDEEAKKLRKEKEDYDV